MIVLKLASTAYQIEVVEGLLEVLTLFLCHWALLVCHVAWSAAFVSNKRDEHAHNMSEENVS
jgi:hypothetical protein